MNDLSDRNTSVRTYQSKIMHLSLIYQIIVFLKTSLSIENL